MEQKEYSIGGRVFIHRPLVIGQMRDFLICASGFRYAQKMDAISFIGLNADKIPRGLAVILVEKGAEIRDRDLDALQKFMAENVSPLTTLEVVEDFFGWNDFPSLLEKAKTLKEKMKAIWPGSTTPSPSSAEETSPGETQSSGDTPSGNVSPS